MDYQLKRRCIDITWYRCIDTTRQLDPVFAEPPSTCKGYVVSREKVITKDDGTQHVSNTTVILEHTTYPVQTLDELAHPVFGRLRVVAVHIRNHPMNTEVWDAEVIL